MGFFMVDVKTENQPWHEVFRRAGNQGNHWHKGFVELSVSVFPLPYFLISVLFFFSLQYSSFNIQVFVALYKE